MLYFQIREHKCPQCSYSFWQPMGSELPACPRCRAKPEPVGEWEDHYYDTSINRLKDIE